MKQVIIPLRERFTDELATCYVRCDDEIESELADAEALVDVTLYTNTKTFSIYNLENFGRTRIIGMSNTIERIYVFDVSNIIIEGNYPNRLRGLSYNSSTFIKLPPLPQSLYYLNMENCMLEELPELPEELELLYCRSNFLRVLPKLPNTLTTLCCDKNLLQVLPKLPDNLHQLHCNDNLLESLPELPKSLSDLYCDYNKLTKLPSLSDSDLKLLSCNGNKITHLPRLPPTLKYLYCDDNTDLLYLPLLSHRMRDFTYNNTHLHEIIDEYILPEEHLSRIRMIPELVDASGNIIHGNIQERSIVRKLNTYHNFLNLCCALKYKNQFIKWLWKSREKKIQEQYSPEKLKELLETNEEQDLDEILEKWE